jgi:lysophospholipase L1-like esterase
MNRSTCVILAAVAFSCAWVCGRAASEPQAAPAAKMRVEENDETYEQQVKRLAIPFRPDLRRLFVCGDSISVGYGPTLKVTLQNQINVTHRRDLPQVFPALVKPLRGYSGPARSLLEYTAAVLNSPEYRPDILLLNCGLHDVARGPAGKKAEQYERDLEALFALVQGRHVTLVWVQTTPKAAGHRDNPEILEFNRISARVLGGRGVALIDLHAFTTALIAGHGEANVIRPDGVHFTRFACEAQGRFSASELQKILQPKQP